MIRGALQSYLGQRIAVEAVSTEAEDTALRITIAYRTLRSGTAATAAFTLGGA